MGVRYVDGVPVWDGIDEPSIAISGSGATFYSTAITASTRRILRCPLCGQESNGDVSAGASCARCIDSQGYLTPMIPYIRELP